MNSPREIRDAAIEHHHALSSWFEASYRALSKDRFTNEFTYGRAKIDHQIETVFRAIPAGSAILDVGCGTGEQLRLAESCGLVAYGVEPAPGMLEIARRNVPAAQIQQGVATQLPFADAMFDAVIEIEVLRYLHRDETRQALKEARRVLKPSGQVLITLVNRWALDGFFLRQRWRQMRQGKAFSTINPHCDFITPAEAVSELEAAGFTDVTIHGKMLAPLRVAWRVAPTLTSRFARKWEHLDDRLHDLPWMQRFAGHLIAIGRAPQ